MNTHKQFVQNTILRYLFMVSLLLGMTASTWAKHEKDSVPILRHELSLALALLVSIHCCERWIILWVNQIWQP